MSEIANHDSELTKAQKNAKVHRNFRRSARTSVDLENVYLSSMFLAILLCYVSTQSSRQSAHIHHGIAWLLTRLCWPDQWTFKSFPSRTIRFRGISVFPLATDLASYHRTILANETLASDDAVFVCSREASNLILLFRHVFVLLPRLSRARHSIIIKFSSAKLLLSDAIVLVFRKQRFLSIKLKILFCCYFGHLTLPHEKKETTTQQHCWIFLWLGWCGHKKFFLPSRLRMFRYII